MLSFLPAPLRGVIVSLAFILNLVFWAVPIYVVIFLKLLPIPVWQGWCTDLMHFLCKCWLRMNTILAEFLHRRTWHIHHHSTLSTQGKYVVVSNHQSWNDIYAMMHVVGRDVPFFKFFIKQELIWVPILGLVWWALDYPFMKRYSKAQLRARPELAGKDLLTARQACEKYRRQPVTVLNYVEGTRFTPAKHDAQASPYTHLLKPKTGGLALAVAALGDQPIQLLDVTIAYHDGAKGFWEFMRGDMREVSVDIRELPIPNGWRDGDYAQDREFRAAAQAWMAEVWQAKDERITFMLANPGVAPPA